MVEGQRTDLKRGSLVHSPETSRTRSEPGVKLSKPVIFSTSTFSLYSKGAFSKLPIQSEYSLTVLYPG